MEKTWFSRNGSSNT